MGNNMSLSNKRQMDQDHPSLERVRVLVVEDTWHVAKALKSALENVGMDVSGPAATTAQARRLMIEHMPRVAVVDVNLKGEMAGGLIKELHDRGVPVVVVIWLRGSSDLGGQRRSHPTKAIQRVRIVGHPASSIGASPGLLKDRLAGCRD
jgi:response regulator RpfG family c-di-GMP phosphodiesterase